MTTLTLIPALLLIPLVFAILSLLVTRPWRNAFALLGIALQAVAALSLSWVIFTEGASSTALGNWAVPLGILLVADGLTVTLLTLTAFIAVICALYAFFYLRAYPREERYFWPLFWFLLAALNGIWLADDLFNLYVGLELLGLAAVGMVALQATQQSLAAALRYLLAALFGSLMYLLGVALLYGSYGTLAMGQLSDLMVGDLTTQIALLLMTLGLLIKTACFPFHYWLPPAHGGALAPVSALLSALVVKSSFYILARIWLDLGTLAVPIGLPEVLGLLGTCAILYGAWRAYTASEIKMLVAWSTVAQLGYLLLLFPLALNTTEAAAHLAWQGTLMHLLAHGFAKGAMFLAVGTLVLAARSTQLSDLAGISRKLPMALFAYGLAAVSLMGLPPSGGFSAKWLLIQSALHSGQWVWIIVISVGSLLSAAYLFRVFSVSFVEGKQRELQPTHPMLDVTALTLALIAIALGFFGMIPLSLMELGTPLPESPLPTGGQP
ncbi:MAG: oxidoreductase [Idiomarina sp.]|nr:oxidoreductase [Idiomarina sp.]